MSMQPTFKPQTSSTSAHTAYRYTNLACTLYNGSPTHPPHLIFSARSVRHFSVYWIRCRCDSKPQSEQWKDACAEDRGLQRRLGARRSDEKEDPRYAARLRLSWQPEILCALFAAAAGWLILRNLPPGVVFFWGAFFLVFAVCSFYFRPAFWSILMTTLDSLGLLLASGALSLQPTTVGVSSSICVEGSCIPGAVEQSATESQHPNSDNVQMTGSNGLSISLSSYPTLSQSATFVVTVEPSPTAAASLQTEGAGPKDGNSGLSSGAVAGIAIATLIAGAMVAFVVTFFLFKRRNRARESNVANKDYNGYADSTPEFVILPQRNNARPGGRNSPYVQVSQTPTPTPTPRPAVVASSFPPSTQHPDDTGVAAFLPDIAPETKVFNKAMALFSECHSHTETYYRDVHAIITPSMEADLAQFGAKGVNMAELLQECSSPITVLKHAIVAYVLQSTAPPSQDNDETIFPDELSGIYAQEDDGDSVDPNVSAARTLHRRLLVYLFNAAPPTTLSHRGPLIDANVHAAAQRFSLTFFPWANPSASNHDRDEALAGLLHMALRLNIWLYGEPFLYEFAWEETGRRGIMVSPNLVRRTEGPGSQDGKAVVVEGVVMTA
ncbi:predicted protein [Plenodomus lingam JN3]|uniref:Predicted protein n=1 Tax=Leptosphaeria maculans (strain JN3 / isolate v23.1.3 / race Av1-4-5-6-7-8) TaxID=985895 RepID=E4ZP05_LEPMJ|nr:predicted protein [Plenodomus lingam JN3]CBX93374.1 predicted protein [Plenodomus lingam JN3]